MIIILITSFQNTSKVRMNIEKQASITQNVKNIVSNVLHDFIQSDRIKVTLLRSLFFSLLKRRITAKDK